MDSVHSENQLGDQPWVEQAVVGVDEHSFTAGLLTESRRFAHRLLIGTFDEIRSRAGREHSNVR
jgi:hypothetical protein